mmetsp:Transcript_9187/g.24076  ORF Transcript_9187/g.24076 Transcript_9187/m.24076 type:complete len:211 (+) Transcript_9187:1047-1679(+)
MSGMELEDVDLKLVGKASMVSTSIAATSSPSLLLSLPLLDFLSLLANLQSCCSSSFSASLFFVFPFLSFSPFFPLESICPSSPSTSFFDALSFTAFFVFFPSFASSSFPASSPLFPFFSFFSFFGALLSCKASSLPLAFASSSALSPFSSLFFFFSFFSLFDSFSSPFAAFFSCDWKRSLRRSSSFDTGGGGSCSARCSALVVATPAPAS